jgi:hypothetical protein
MQLNNDSAISCNDQEASIHFDQVQFSIRANDFISSKMIFSINTVFSLGSLRHLHRFCDKIKWNQVAYLGWVSKNNLRTMLEICALRPSFLHKFTQIWHHALSPCAQLIAFSPRFGCALRFMPCTQFLRNAPLEKKIFFY